MKKTLFLFVPVFALAALSLVILSCPNPSSPSSDAKVLSITVSLADSPANSPADSTVIRGTTQEFIATVNVSGGASKAVTWTVEAVTGTPPMSSGTKIEPKLGEPSKAILTVAAGGTETQLRVTATSTVNKSVTGSATVNIANENATVTGISIIQKPESVTKGNTEPYSITADVDVEHGVTKAVNWELSALDAAGQTVTKHQDTKITDNSTLSSGIIKANLVVSSEETAAALVVTVTSQFDSTKSASATIPIIDTANPPVVTGVTVSVEGSVSEALRGSNTVRFTAQVSGTGPFTQIVAWSIVTSGVQSGTGISADGVLTVAAYEPLDSLTIRAVSTHSPSTPSPASNFFGEHTISVRYNDMYLIGDAFSGGEWPAAPASPGAASGVKMTKGLNGVYTWTGGLNNGKTFKFHDDLIQDWNTGNWFAPAVNDTDASATQTVVLANASGANAFKVTAASGQYTITLDTAAKTVTFISPDSGNVNVTWSLAADKGGNLSLVDAAPFTVYKTGGAASVTVSVSTAGYTYVWYVDGVSKGTVDSITIAAADYSPGGHELRLAAKDSTTGVVWSAPPVKFTVAKQ